MQANSMRGEKCVNYYEFTVTNQAAKHQMHRTWTDFVMSSSSMSTLRFAVGSKVLTNVGTWEEATVTKHWSIEGRMRVPYRMRILKSGDDVFANEDSDYYVRSYEERGLPRLLQAIRCGDPVEHCKGLVEEFALDLDVVGDKILFEAAAYGHSDVYLWLAEMEVDVSVRDKSGRNVVHIALQYAQFDFLDQISPIGTDDLTAKDNKGFNVVHYVILSKSVEVLRDVLFDNYLFGGYFAIWSIWMGKSRHRKGYCTRIRSIR